MARCACERDACDHDYGAARSFGEVEDTGPGIAAGDMDRLFQSFFTTKDGGMGIGLAVSRSIIENHQGRIWVEPNDGPGTSFSFSIPQSPVSAIRECLSSPARKPAANQPAEVARNL